MANYAIHNGSIITNVIVADSQEIAESITGLQAFENTNGVGIGWVLVDGDWRTPSPYPSWVFSNGSWQAPTPKPDEGDAIWDEPSQRWIDESMPIYKHLKKA